MSQSIAHGEKCSRDNWLHTRKYESQESNTQEYCKAKQEINCNKKYNAENANSTYKSEFIVCICSKGLELVITYEATLDG